MPRILVCGCSGSGKTTFSRKLGALVGLTSTSLDSLHWNPGWIESDHQTLRARVAPLLAEENWIIDGNYLSALGDLHLSRATHVIFFDLPRWKCLLGAFLRIIKHQGKVRPDMAPGCPERFDFVFFRYIWNFRAKVRPQLATAFRAMRPDQRRFVFHRHGDADAFLARVSREGLA